MADPTLTLFHEFARNKNLIASKGLGPTLGITRASTATFFDSAGVLQTAASGVARFDHDPSTNESLGLLVEETRTNLSLQSGNLVTAPWTSIQTPGIATNNAISPRGLLEVTLFTDNNATNREGVQQSITVPNDSATHTSSVFVKKTTGATSPTFGLEMNYSGGTQTAPVEVRLNTDTGETNGEGGGGTQAQDFGDYWRVWGRSTNNSTGNTTLQVKVFPALAAHGSFVDVAATTGSAHAWGVQAELGSTPTSYIETFGASVLRAADLISTTDLSWFNPLEGTLFTDTIVPPIESTGGGTPFILVLDDGGSTNRIIHVYKRETGNYDATAFMKSRTLSDATLDLVENDILRMASSWKGSTHAASFNGNASLIDSATVIPTGLTTLRLAAPAGTVQNNGHMREIRYYNVKKDDTFIVNLSNGLISEDNDLTFIRHLARPLVRSLARKLTRPTPRNLVRGNGADVDNLLVDDNLDAYLIDDTNNDQHLLNS